MKTDCATSYRIIARFIENVIYSDALTIGLQTEVIAIDDDLSVYDENETVDSKATFNNDKYMVNGVGSYGKCSALYEAVKVYASLNHEITAEEIATKWTNLNVCHLPHLIETEEQFVLS